MATPIGIGTGSGISRAPGVTTTEVAGLTTAVSGGASSTGALAGVFRWGPVNLPISIDGDEDMLVAKFGTPTNYNSETWFAAANFLAYGNDLLVCRVGNTASDMFSAVANTSNVSSFSTHSIENDDDYDAKKDSFESGVQFIAKYPGALGNSLRVSAITNGDQFRSSANLRSFSSNTLFDDANTGLSLSVGSNTATITLANTSVLDSDTPLPLAQEVADTIVIGDNLEVGNNSVGQQNLRITSVDVEVANTGGANTGTAVITLGLSEPLKISTDVAVQNLTRSWEYAGNVRGAPKTSGTQASANGEVVDTMHIVISDEDGQFTGRPGAILEVYQDVSRASDAKTQTGESNFYNDVLNNQSAYVWAASESTDIPVDTHQALTNTSDTTPFTVSFVGGADGAGEGTVSVGTMAKGWDLFAHDEEYDIAALIVGKTYGGTVGEQMLNYVIDNVAEKRGDCIVYGSVAKDVVVNNSGDIEQDAVDFRDVVRRSSYAALDSGYKWQYDKYNDTFRWIPLNGDSAGLSARSDVTDSPAAAPAGLARGQIRNIIRLAWNPTKAQQATLFSNDINSVVRMKGEGTYLMGDKTLYGSDNALDSIGVRKMLNLMKTSVADAARQFVFEMNDEFTQARFKSLVTPYLRDLKARRQIKDFEVICDESNNTEQVVRDRRFVGDIKFLPNFAARFVHLNFAPVNGTAVFEENA